MSVSLHASIPRLLHKPGYVFSGIDVFTALPAGTEPRRSLLDIGVELVPVVECGHHDVPALAPIRVIAVVPNDPATDAVVVRIHPSHDCSIRVEGDRTLVRGCGWRVDNWSWGQNWCRSDRAFRPGFRHRIPLAMRSISRCNLAIACCSRHYGGAGGSAPTRRCLVPAQWRGDCPTSISFQGAVRAGGLASGVGTSPSSCAGSASCRG
jgi:hypothetical protein